MPGIELPDLADPKTYACHDPYEIWRQLRHSDPVHWHASSSGRPAFWVLTRYADIVDVLRDDTRFTSERGNVLATMLAGGDTGAGRMMAVTDGSYHTELRKLLLKAFTPRALHTVVQRVRQFTRRLLTEAIERGGRLDFARDIASAIPLQTICDLLDIPPADRRYVLDLTKSALAYEDDAPDAGTDRPNRGDILLYFSDLVADRRRHPGADPISLMAGTEVAGRTLDDEDIILNCYSLIMGGNETSRFSMIGAVQAFIDLPDQWSLLRNGDVSLDSAGEEVLRWATPTMHFGRAATESVRLAGRTIAAGDLVTLWLGSANRDEYVFPEPDKFILARSPNKHLALGHGRHFCLGAYLGRIEIQAMLDGLRTFVSDIERAGETRRIYSNFLSGISSLPVVFKGDAKGYRDWADEI